MRRDRQRNSRRDACRERRQLAKTSDGEASKNEAFQEQGFGAHPAVSPLQNVWCVAKGRFGGAPAVNATCGWLAPVPAGDHAAYEDFIKNSLRPGGAEWETPQHTERTRVTGAHWRATSAEFVRDSAADWVAGSASQWPQKRPWGSSRGIVRRPPGEQAARLEPVAPTGRRDTQQPRTPESA